MVAVTEGSPSRKHHAGHRQLSASDEQIRDWIDLATFAVLAAGPIALQHFRTEITVDDKRSRGVFDPVTAADRDVEASIRDFLRRHLPEHRVVGEEHPEAKGDERYTWIIDPIDGTRAFISGLPVWGTLVGLLVDGVPVGGVMHQPFTGETFVADPVRGSLLVHRGSMRPLHTRHLQGGLADAVLYSTHPSQLEVVGASTAFEAVADRVRLQRWGGDCYAFAMLAAGCIDLVIEGDLKSYDVAALIPIVEQAGGVVTDLAGNPPTFGGELVIASGDPRLHAEVLAILRAELGPRV
jgi:histidinol phosphatase-like enzyme (inositol monophosphatase family)